MYVQTALAQAKTLYAQSGGQLGAQPLCGFLIGKKHDREIAAARARRLGAAASSTGRCGNRHVLRGDELAIEHSGEAGRLTVEAERGPDGASIEIADEGPGIPDAVLPHLFQPFGGSGKVSGTGLGLAIARELARNHGGELILLRTGPGGTAFRLTLPGRKGRGP